MGTDRITLKKSGIRGSGSLYHHVLRYTQLFIVIMILEGAALGYLTQRSNKAYEDLYTSSACIQEISGKSNVLSEMVRKYIVSGEENADACFRQWEQLTDSISELKITETETTLLLAEDLKVYQRNTAAEFQSLMRETDPDRIVELYTLFQQRQEDRNFLCEQLARGLTAYVGLKFPELGHRNIMILWGIYAVLSACTLLMLLYSFSFARSVSSPVLKLAGQARELMEGHYEVEDLPVEHEDELGYLTHAFNEMKQRINENFTDREELWRMKTLLQEAEFKALQSQVNPHFLFNVLSVAIESAMVEDAERTIDIIENISYMLRYSLTSVKDNTLLSEELKMVRSYLFLQKERFGSRIRFEADLPEEVPAQVIPGMTLQPIVENAIRHGVEHMTGGGWVRISITETDDAAEILVEDNGCGIPEEQLRKMREGIPADSRSSTGIGIANVMGRLNAYYGKNGLLSIDSKVGEGTQVRIRYPRRPGV